MIAAEPKSVVGPAASVSRDGADVGGHGLSRIEGLAAQSAGLEAVHPAALVDAAASGCGSTPSRLTTRLAFRCSAPLGGRSSLYAIGKSGRAHSPGWWAARSGFRPRRS